MSTRDFADKVKFEQWKYRIMYFNRLNGFTLTPGMN